MRQAVEWSGEVPDVLDECIHSLVARQVQRQPAAPAICAWDGVFTYAELDAAAEILARHLVTKLGVEIETLVHVCFEKSAWFFVAILAINKAGGAWVPLEPSHPVQRHEEVVRQTRSTLALASPAQAETCRGLGLHVLEVDAAFHGAAAHGFGGAGSGSGSGSGPSAAWVRPSGRHAAYCLFTSGSTGIPKGVVMDNRAVCTSQLATAKRMRMSQNTRMLQFSSCVFDACIFETVATLAAGGCLCVPSEHSRMNELAKFINDHAINWAALTPSVARTLAPQQVPALEVLVVGGEAAGRDILEAWVEHVRLINVWGPTETCVNSTIHEWQSARESPLTIGRPVGGHCWIVDPEDPRRLVPAGCTGEVLIQGPTLLREYLHDRQKTDDAVITRLPDWAPRAGVEPWSRMFRSGDLAFRNADGTIEFVGRKDNQVKIRGLRVELGEVEHHLRMLLPHMATAHVVTDAVQIDRSGVHLVAYLRSSPAAEDGAACNNENGDGEQPEGMFIPLSAALKRQMDRVVVELRAQLPMYMVPTIFIPCRHLPYLASGKLDRKRLREQTASLSPDQLAAYALVDAAKRPPETPMEEKLQKLWSSVLGLSVDSIGRDDNFLQLGGDSISAIRLVSQARRCGIELTVASVLDDAHLRGMASKASTINSAVNEKETELPPVPAFSLLTEDKLDHLLDQSRKQCHLADGDVIEDAYPCTPLQEGLMALTISQPGYYIIRLLYKLSAHVDMERFKQSWSQTVSAHATLRTRIVLVDERATQVVVKQRVAWSSTDDGPLQSVLEQAKRRIFSYGSQLCHYALADGPDGQPYFALTLHHAIYDGWSMNLAVGTLTSLYHKTEAHAVQSFSRFIQHLGRLDYQAGEAFWSEQMDGAKPSHFLDGRVRQGSPTVRARLDRSRTRPIRFRLPADSIFTKATMLRAAWLLTVSWHCNSDDVCVGTSVSGRQAPIPGLDRTPGPVVATVPLRVRIRSEQTVGGFMRDIQRQASEMVPFEHFGLQNIARVSADAREACDFACHLVIQPAQLLHSFATQDTIMRPVEATAVSDEGHPEGYLNYPLLVQIIVHDDHVDFHTIFDSHAMSDTQAEALSHHFEGLLQQLLGSSDTTLGDLSPVTEWDVQQAGRWNEHVPEVVDECIHQLVQRQVQCQPGAPAISAWDGEFTYAELDGAANALARHLVLDLGVKVEHLVTVCFEKSIWFFVALLAINKAGGAWVPLDPSHPSQRHKDVLLQTRSTLALTSADQAEACRRLGLRVVQVDSAFHEAHRSDQPPLAWSNLASGRNTAYCFFTSGSTGQPKGVVMENRAVCTSQVATAERLGMDSNTRMLQFSSYIFDACIFEIVATLASGGCICVPSEHSRMNDLASFISESSVSWAALTPSVTRTLAPQQTPSLAVLVLIGEPSSRDILNIWYGRVRLINGWGPTETCVYSALHEWRSVDDSPLTIGRPVGGHCWIVNPHDLRLAPIGCTGELLIQGPTLLREYLADRPRTDTTVLAKLPGWAPRRHEEAWARMYRTGDLAFYNADGTIEFLGRKDTQVKLRGLRVELGEIEHNIRLALPDGGQVVVDTFETDTGLHLVAYIHGQPSERPEPTSLFLPLSVNLKHLTAHVVRELKARLPRYMVPTIFIPCGYWPYVTSGKLDRKKLREQTASLSAGELAAYALVDATKRPPATATERELQTLWASVLGIPADSIGRDDSFFQLGGDSIGAIHLVSQARRRGIDLTVSSIFDDARLHQMASKMPDITYPVDKLEPLCIPAFSLLPQDGLDHLLDKVYKQCHLAEEDVIEDAYPCTPLQEGLMALTITQPGFYIIRLIYKLSAHVDVDRFKQSWMYTVSAHAALRTRIVLVDERAIQVVLNRRNQWNDDDNRPLDTVLQETKGSPFSYGTELCHYGLARGSDGSSYFSLTMHHSVYDGWSMNLIRETLSAFYYGTTTANPIIQPFNGFVQYVRSLDEQAGAEFWKAQMNGAKRTKFLHWSVRHGSNARVRLDRSRRRSIPLRLPADSSITKATILRAAWVLTLSWHCNTDDICVGTSVSGRQAPVPGLDRTSGPVLATVPLRVRLHPEQDIRNLLKDMQRQASEMVPFEQFGLQNIAKLSPEAHEACDFSNHLIIQPARLLDSDAASHAIMTPAEASRAESDQSVLEGYLNYPLVVQLLLHDEQVEVEMAFDSRTMADMQAEALSKHFEAILTQLVAGHNATVGSISPVGPWDVRQATGWNEEVPDLVDECIHEVVARQVRRQPEAPAIRAWDGALTYAELDGAATALARRLVVLGVRVESLVPVCFEKSVWFFVAILAINKAGAAWVPLDPSHPAQRLQEVIRQTQSNLALASPGQSGKCRSLGLDVLEVDSALPRVPQPYSMEEGLQALPKQADGRHAAYCFFTSGSTGTPKGVLLENRAVCTSQVATAKRLRMDSNTRMLHFSSSVFDICILEIVATLASGGCVYVPSEHSRVNELAKFINDHAINWAALTPSVARTLQPQEVPSLEVLLLIGEASSRDVLDTWFGRVRLINGWGPTETCVNSAYHEWKFVDESPLTIGRPIGGHGWIVNPEDPHQLAPIGCVGELVIQGPSLLREYLSNPQRTEESVLTSLPEWAPRKDEEPWGRMYRSGDLAFHNADGTIEFLGRRDTQVRIRGLRVELGEIEHNIHLALPDVEQVVVDTLQTGNDNIHLVAYLRSPATASMVQRTEGEHEKSESMFLPLSGDLESKIALAVGELKIRLPLYMIPTIFIPCRYLPYVTSAKLDRKQIRERTASLTPAEMAAYALVEASKRPPETAVEKQLQRLWANVLSLPVDSIGRDDSFLQIGGDSFTAIQLVLQARQYGIELAVASIFEDARLCSLAAQAQVDIHFADSSISTPHS